MFADLATYALHTGGTGGAGPAGRPDENGTLRTDVTHNATLARGATGTDGTRGTRIAYPLNARSAHLTGCSDGADCAGVAAGADDDTTWNPGCSNIALWATRPGGTDFAGRSAHNIPRETCRTDRTLCARGTGWAGLPWRTNKTGLVVCDPILLGSRARRSGYRECGKKDYASHEFRLLWIASSHRPNPVWNF